MLKVICAGMPRTGTFSLKKALEEIGLGPCYHMDEVFRRPEHVAAWRGAHGGDDVDWAKLLDGYRSAADAPPCLFWRELAAAFPEAKIVLTTRPAGDWYESFEQTVYHAMTHPEQMPAGSTDALAMARELVLDGFFDGHFEDRRYALAAYQRHNDEVVRSGRDVLEFEVADGWAPLCAFLGVDVPETPFPNTNSRTRFKTFVNEG